MCPCFQALWKCLLHPNSEFNPSISLGICKKGVQTDLKSVCKFRLALLLHLESCYHVNKLQLAS